jgi:hypothetical protein
VVQYDTITLNNEKRINDDIEKRIDELRNKIILKDVNKIKGPRLLKRKFTISFK